MKTKIDNTLKMGKQRGGFGIQILYPGIIRPEKKDSGFATIGRIDHAKVSPGTLVPMHPHRNDEILTYLRSGQVNHRDSEGLTNTLSNQQLMLMNAGKTFYHEEQVLEEGEALEGLQIFIRPETDDLKPRVQFLKLDEVFSFNKWRKIAGPRKEYPMTLRSETVIMDMHLEKGQHAKLPDSSFPDKAFLLYAFSGKIRTDDGMILQSGESVLIEDENLNFEAVAASDLVLFITQTTAPYTINGMYSGNQHATISAFLKNNSLETKV